ncbi:hypothetical protein Tco_1536484 [Tanacetum coccineum]
MYNAILKKKITKKEDKGGNFVIPCIVEDVLVEIAGYIYPVDIMILDVKEDKKKPFILGTPFLQRVEEGTENDIDPVAPTTTVSRLILEWEEIIKLHQEKEMEFNQWRSKVFNDECSALVNKGCEVSYEGGVT